MNVYLRNKCMVNYLNIGGWNSSSCKMTQQRARERHWDSVHLVSSHHSLVHVHSIARCCHSSPPYILSHILMQSKAHRVLLGATWQLLKSPIPDIYKIDPYNTIYDCIRTKTIDLIQLI